METWSKLEADSATPEAKSATQHQLELVMETCRMCITDRLLSEILEAAKDLVTQIPDNRSRGANVEIKAGAIEHRADELLQLIHNVLDAAALLDKPSALMVESMT